jgi:hypothetical protein
MRKLLPLILLAPLVLSSCSFASLSKDNGVTSGQLCETFGTYTENNGIEYICWESPVTGLEGYLFWRQNREVEKEYVNESEVLLNSAMEKKYCLESNVLKREDGSLSLDSCTYVNYL